MSKKHYIAMAREMVYTRPIDTKSEAYQQWLRDIKSIANVFSNFNGRFDYNRFVEACKS